MKIEIECSEMVIPLRYYKGWMIEFRVKTERFDCSFLSLFGFLSVPDLEKAIDSVLERRNKDWLFGKNRQNLCELKMNDFNQINGDSDLRETVPIGWGEIEGGEEIE